MEPLDVLRWVEQHQRCTGEHVLGVYQLIRDRGDGTDLPITLTIYEDAGNPNNRYRAVAESKDGRLRACGNSASSIHAVLSTLHWFDLDKPTFP